jgi:DNA polymerase III epsilon subunit-like protein
MPFQWSMLVQAESGSGLVERGPFLHLDATDPRRPFAEALLAALPPGGSIVAHNKAAEIGVINQLADRLGGEVADQLRALVTRFFDTKALAKAGYYHADQHGSWSIKKLAPALLGTGYKGLTIQNGLAAVAAWKRACGEVDPSARDRLRAELLAYCGRDTLLMHEIVEKLRALAGAGR